MNALTVDIVNLEKAGRYELGEAADTYGDIRKKMDGFSVPADTEIWSQVMTDAEGIITDAENNLRVAGTTLRLIAHSYAATDAEAANRIKENTGQTELPTLSNGSWSDYSAAGDLEAGFK